MTKPDPLFAIVDHDRKKVTVAVTFDWAGPLSLDKCEAGAFLGDLRRTILTMLVAGDRKWGAPDGPITGFEYQCYEPDEELQLGWMADYEDITCAGCGKPVRRVPVGMWWRAPEGFEHVDPIDVDEPCDRLSGRYDGPDENVVNYGNRLAVNLIDRTVDLIAGRTLK